MHTSASINQPIEGVIFKECRKFCDDRGWLIELFRTDELPNDREPVMAYVSETEPGVSRGPHEHVDQSDLFGFFGPGDFKLYMWDAREDSPTYGNRAVVIVGESNRQTVIVPPGVVHGYKNISDHPALVFNGPNRLYAGEGKRGPVDEIRHEDDPLSPYAMTEDESLIEK